MTQHLLSVLYVVCLADWMNLVQGRSVRRLCKNEIDLMSDEGVRIEPVERSHVELLLADQKIRTRLEVTPSFSIQYDRNIIKFEFRTTGDNGILFYGRRRQHQNELVALRMLEGNMYYKIECSTVSADVLIPHISKLNDGQWHSVTLKFRRGGLKTHIEVDGIKDSKTYEVSCGQMTSLVFGGVSPDDRDDVHRLMGYSPHFDGCIRRVNIPTALRSPPKYYAISICEH